jgi:multidrug efflux pump subunit AcrA (membrane-fusion protein)
VSPTPTYSEPQPQRSSLMTALVAGAMIALAAACVVLFMQVHDLRAELTKTHDTLLTEISNMRDASTVTASSQTRHLETLKEELEAARTQLKNENRTMSSQAKAEAQAYADRLNKQIEAEQAKVQQQVSSEISDVKQTATQANAKIADVSTDVGTVRSQVSSTQAQLEKTIADLKSAKGDLGVQSGLIATNHDELVALRRMGERNYYEFKLGKEAEKKPARVGDISIQLKKVDPKRNKFTINVLADDKTIEKRDKTVNEPVQFLTAKGGHTPYELIVNQVGKDSISGYLATPKDSATR